MREQDLTGGDSEADIHADRLNYEAPLVIPMGNLKDLLAGNGSQCDAGFSTGNTLPVGNC